MKRKIILVIPLLLLIFIIGYTIADILDNDVRVNVNTDLTYYLSVKYDGVDVFGTESNNEAVAEVYSDIITVIDRIPDGLVFNGFIVSQDGTIGAVRRDNDSIQCLGKVIDDTNEIGNEGVWNNDNTEYTYHGLHYNATTRTVSFRIKNLKAGCVLNVGIKVKTPETIDDPDTVIVEKRRDFYNYAIARENIQTAVSNVVHVYIGEDDSTMYSVTYQLTGDIPEGYINPPTLSYLEGTKVSVKNEFNLAGYTFNGWTSSDVTITDNQFTMPDNNVTLTGSFTRNNSYKVTYTITGTTPNKYTVPLEKNYYEGSDVIVDSLSADDIFNGYTFNGWTSNDVTITDNQFTMPNKNVTITGSFNQLKYKLIYLFQGSVIPENSESLLPETQEYNSGDNITLTNIDDITGYKFLGWNKESNFIMPSENVTVYGEWKRFNGEFEPSISITVIDGKDYYQAGDTIKYKITVSNDEYYPINNVIIKDNLTNIVYKGSEGFTYVNNIATIDSIAANSSFDINAEYTISTDDSNIITNTVELLGALADNYYELKEKSYRDSVTSNLKSKLKLCVYVNGVDVGNSFKIKVSNNIFEYSSILKKDQCMIHYLSPGTYTIKELVPQEYYLESITGNLQANGDSLMMVQGTNYQVNFNNRFKSKKFMHAFGDAINKIVGGN